MSTSTPGSSTTRGLEHPMRRAVLLSVVTVVVALAVVLGYLGVPAYWYLMDKDRASATAAGRVIADGVGDTDDIIVRWTDGRGETQEQRFGVYDTERYRSGASFPVRYDPSEPSPAGYPADPDEDVLIDDYVGGMVVAVAGGLLLVGAWGARWIRWRRSLRLPAHPMSARLLLGSDSLGLVQDSWVHLTWTAPESERVERWQRVMWHPSLDTVRGSVPVQVRGDVRSRRRAGVRLADGTELIPTGRLRHKQPSDLVDPEDVGDDVADAIILPAGAVLMCSPERGWRPATRLAALGAALGLGTSVLAGDATLIAAVLGGAFGVHLWAFHGADPRG